MDAIFLGYKIVDFKNDQGEIIKGYNLFLASDMGHRNYKGFEVIKYYVDFERDNILYNIIEKCIPGGLYKIDYIPSFNGKSKITNLTPIK